MDILIKYEEFPENNSGGSILISYGIFFINFFFHFSAGFSVFTVSVVFLIIWWPFIE